MEIKLNGDIQRYIWSVITEKAQDDAPEWAELILTTRRRCLVVTADNAQMFINAFAWFAEMAEEELLNLDLNSEEKEGNRKEIDCANKVIEKLFKAKG